MCNILSMFKFTASYLYSIKGEAVSIHSSWYLTVNIINESITYQLGNSLKPHTHIQTHTLMNQILILIFDLLYLGRSFWHGGRKLQGAAQTACPAWRWHPGGTAANWPAGPAQRSACPGAAWTGWFSHWQRTASWWRDGQRGERRREGEGESVCVRWNVSTQKQLNQKMSNFFKLTCCSHDSVYIKVSVHLIPTTWHWPVHLSLHTQLNAFGRKDHVIIYQWYIFPNL